jgi:Fur family ferric uptake transcriptional regulator
MTASQLLHKAGLRRTKARKVVLEVLNQVNRPLSHQEIASEPSIDRLERVTLYRTLTTLRQAGLLHRVRGVDGVWRFRGHRSKPGKCGGNHIHFLCLECNQMFCMPEQPLPWVKEPEGAEVFGKQLVVYGHCAACKSRGKGEDANAPRNSGSADAGCCSHHRPRRPKKTHEQ